MNERKTFDIQVVKTKIGINEQKTQALLSE
jgi:hypothetical protein